MRTIALLLISAAIAAAQIATLPATGQQISLSARGGQYFAGSLAYSPFSQFSGFARSIGSSWDAGGTYRAFQVKSYRNGIGSFLDLGATALYGSQGVKGAIEAGYLFGDSEACYFWARGALGNYRAISAGTQLGRLNLSGTWGNYFEDRIDAAVSLDRLQRYNLTAGYSSVLGLNAGVILRWSKGTP